MSVSVSVAIPLRKAGEEAPTCVGLNYTQPRPKSASEKEDFVSAGSRSSTAEPAAGTGVQPLPHPRVAPRGLSSEVLVGTSASS